MNTKIIKTLVKKELLDVLRDKKTVVMMLVVPVILYPLIFIGAMQLVAMISSSMEEQDYRIVIDADDDGRFARRLAENADGADAYGGKGYSLTIVESEGIEDYAIALENEEIDAYILGSLEDNKFKYDVYYISSVTNSEYAMGIIMDVFDEYREELTRDKLEEAGLDAHEILEPILYENKDTASNEQSLGSIMGSILPFMLIISLLMGTIYPAIDTTAGERERGTLETILTLPVTNRQLIVSKFITVAAVGMVSALLNILSMGGIAFYMYKIMDMQTGEAGIDMSRFYPAILVGILAVFAFSLFISAITMCVTSFAQSYKEANNYVTPLMLVVMFAGYIGFIPNIELTRAMAAVPVANICLLIKNMLAFKIDYTIIAIVLISNIAYAVFSVLFLSRIYDSEAILFGDSGGGLQLFEKRKNLVRGGVPSLSDVWFVAALTIMLVIYAGSMLQLKFGLMGVFGTQLILLTAPLAVALYTKKDIKKTYGFKKANVKSFIGAILTVVGMYPVNMVLSLALSALFPASSENVTETFTGLMGGNVMQVFLIIAVAPAICEELLFRGFMFNSLKERYRAVRAMVIVAVLFGIYHMSVIKFIPTALLGFIFCYVAYESGSIFPSMVMHFLNNAFSVMIICYEDKLRKICPILYEESVSVSDILLLLGGGILLLTAGCLFLGKSKKDKAVEADSGL